MQQQCVKRTIYKTRLLAHSCGRRILSRKGLRHRSQVAYVNSARNAGYNAGYSQQTMVIRCRGRLLRCTSDDEISTPVWCQAAQGSPLSACADFQAGTKLCRCGRQPRCKACHRCRHFYHYHAHMICDQRCVFEHMHMCMHIYIMLSHDNTPGALNLSICE